MSFAGFISIRWSPPGDSSCVPFALITKPPAFGCMTILPSFMVISCSSIGDAVDSAAVTVMSLPVSLTSTPNAAVMVPASAAFTQGSLIVRVVAAADAVVAGPAAAVVAVVAALSSPQPVRPRASAVATMRNFRMPHRSRSARD